MAIKQLNTRLSMKTDTTENWLKAVNFSPLKGELIIYQDENALPRMKIGDGETNVNSLSFIDEDIVNIINTYQQYVDINTENNSVTIKGNLNVEGNISEGLPSEEDAHLLSFLNLEYDELGKPVYVFNANIKIKGTIEEEDTL